MKRALIPCLILLLAAASWGQETINHDGSEAVLKRVSEPGLTDQKEVPHVSSKSGSALLDLFLVNMREMTGQGAQRARESIDKRLQEMMQAAKKAREANEIDGLFFSRFNRLLAVTMLVVVPDPTGILTPVINDILGEYIQAKLGHDEFRAEGGKGPKAISYVAAAMGAEIIDLQIYLQTAKQREALQFSLQEKMVVGPKK
jgi:hypothetical protein